MISQFGHRYKAKISTDISNDLPYWATQKDRHIQLFNYFMKNNCKILTIKELKTRKNSIIKKYEIEFEDGERGVAYSNIGEVVQLIKEVDFEMIRVTK